MVREQERKKKRASSERGGIRLKVELSTAVSTVPKATEQAGGVGANRGMPEPAEIELVAAATQLRR